MPQVTPQIRTSLEVGFADGALPPEFAPYRGREHRAIANLTAFPYEDAQFEVVMMDAKSVNPKTVKEAHRVLKPSGRLYFKVPEKSSKQAGFTLPNIYSIVRDGFDIVGVTRTPWWKFGFGGRTIEICAQKKNWKSLTNTYRPYV